MTGPAAVDRASEARSRPRIVVGGVGVAALLMVGAWLHARSYDFVSDDTFIALRYARNLLEGHGLVFNVGERVEGFSSFASVLMLAGLGSLGVDLLTAARGLSMLATLACMLLAWRVVWGAGGSPWGALTAPALIATSAPVACWALAGLDAPVFAALSLAAVATGDRLIRGGSAWAAGTAAGLLVWARPEGALAATVFLATASFFVGAARLRRTLPAWSLLVLSLGVLLLVRRSYYGEWLPNTYHAKMGALSVDLVGRGLTYLADYARDAGGTPLLLAPLLAACWRRDATWWIVAVTLAGLVGCTVLEGGDGLPMYRFLVPAVPLWSALCGMAVADGVARLGPPGGSVTPRRVLPWLLAVGLAAWGGACPGPDSEQYLRYRGQRDFELEAWTAAGRWLRRNAAPGASVACVPIGAVGYYSGLPLIDMLGLTDRHIARVPLALGQGWAGHEKHDGKYVLSRQPTYLLLGNVRVLDRALPLGHPEFVRIRHPAVEAREGDVYVRELEEHYEPRVVSLGGGLFLHFLQRRP
ncbi:MAG: hypothetical protein R3F56_14655 [Planctomycetota bacterium]